MAFKQPAIPPPTRRGRNIGGNRGARGVKLNKSYIPGQQRPPFITVNKTRSRSRTRKRLKIESDDDLSDLNTDSDFLLSEDDAPISKNNKIQVLNKEIQQNISKPSTSYANSEQLERRSNQQLGSLEKQNENTDKQEFKVTNSYSDILGKNNIMERNKEDENIIYNDKRANLFLRKAIWFTRNRNLDFSVYVSEIENVIGIGNIVDIQMVAYNKVEIYLKTEEQATMLAVNGLTVNERQIRIFHMVKHPLKIFITGIKPWIDDKEVIQAMKNVGYCEQKSLQKLEYVDSNRNIKINCGTRIMMICRRPEVPLPKVVNLHINGDTYKLEIVPEFVKCHNCGEPGHIIKNCMNAMKKSTRIPNYDQNFPEMGTGNIIKEEIEKMLLQNEQRNKVDANTTQNENKDRRSQMEMKQMKVPENIANAKDISMKVYENTINKDFKVNMKEEQIGEELKIDSELYKESLIDEYAANLLKKENSIIDRYIRLESQRKECNNQEVSQQRGSKIQSKESKDIKMEDIQVNIKDMDENKIIKEESQTRNEELSMDESSTLQHFDQHFDELENLIQQSVQTLQKVNEQEEEAAIKCKDNEELMERKDDKSVNKDKEQNQEQKKDEPLDTYNIKDIREQEKQEDDSKSEDEKIETKESDMEMEIEDKQTEIEESTNMYVANENIIKMEQMLEAKQDKKNEICFLKNVEEESTTDIEDQSLQDKRKDKTLKLKEWKSYDEDIKNNPEIFKFCAFIVDAYNRREKHIRTFPDAICASFKLRELVQTIIDHAEIYDAYGKLGDINNLLIAKLKYDKAVKSKLLQQKMTAAAIASNLGYPANVELSMSKIDFWTGKIEVGRIVSEQECIDQIYEIEDFIKIKITEGVFPKDQMTEVDYIKLSDMICTNFTYLRKSYKLRLLINRLMYNKYGKTLIEKWDDKLKEKIYKYTDVTGFKEFDITQKTVIGGFKKEKK